jgi:predicted O-methyltransferase YrrM
LPDEEKFQQIHSRIDAIYASGVVAGDDGQVHRIAPRSVARHRGEFLANLVRSERPRATLEVGMAWGRSTLFILGALFENGDEFSRHVVMDPYQSKDFGNAALVSLRDLGIADRVEFYEDPSQLALPALARRQRLFDFAFIDGYHQFDSALVDLFYVDSMLKPGGMVVIDDMDWDPVYLVGRFAETHYGYKTVAQTGNGHEEQRRLPAPPGRARIRAYRKPLQHDNLPQHVVAPFFADFTSSILPPGARNEAAGALRHKGRVALRSSNRALARLYFKLALRSEPLHFKAYLYLLRTYM